MHLLPEGSEKLTFLCGRKKNDDTEAFTGSIYSDGWKCKQCDANKPLRDVGAVASFMAKRAMKRVSDGA